MIRLLVEFKYPVKWYKSGSGQKSLSGHLWNMMLNKSSIIEIFLKDAAFVKRTQSNFIGGFETLNITP